MFWLYLLHVQRWLANGGYKDPRHPITIDFTEPSSDVIGAFANFLSWYANGRQGDPSKARKGGRKVCDMQHAA